MLSQSVSMFTLLLAAQLLAAPQGPTPGAVYSAVQAERGKKVVENHCTACHGDDLSGLEGPALVGNSFMVKWEPQDLGALFKERTAHRRSGRVEQTGRRVAERPDDSVVECVSQSICAHGAQNGRERSPRERCCGSQRECAVARDARSELPAIKRMLTYGSQVEPMDSSAVTLMRLSGRLISRPFTITL